MPKVLFTLPLVTDPVVCRADFEVGVVVVEQGASASIGQNVLTIPRFPRPTNVSRNTMTSLGWSMRRKERNSGRRCGETCPTASALPDQEVKRCPCNSF